MDCEGQPTQELSGILVSCKNFAIIDVFHAHAHVGRNDDDRWSRKNIHGLSLNFLEQFAFPSERELVCAFHVWKSRRQIDFCFANNPGKERKLLDLVISDLPLPVWKDRPTTAAHQLALSYKKNETPIGNQACTKDIHCAFNPIPPSSSTPSAHARREWGYHCSLYDCLELYFHLLMIK